MTQVPLKLLVDPRRPITYGIVQAGPDTPAGVPYIRPTDMTPTSGVTDPARLLRTTPEIAATYKRSQVLPGDVVLSIGPSYGKVMNVPPELSGANLTQGTARLAPAPGISPRFLYWALQSKPARDYWNMAVAGATFRALNLEPLSLTPMFKVESTGQRRIADLLDDQVARLDAAIAAQVQQRILLLERFRSELAARTLLRADSPRVQRSRAKYLFQYERNGIWGADSDGGTDDIACVRVADFDRERFTATTAPTIRSVPRAQRLSRLLRRGDVLLEKSGGTNDKPVGCAVSYESDEPAVCSNFVAALRPAEGIVPRFAGLLLAAMYQTRRNGPFVNQTTGIQNLDSNAYLSQEVWLPDHGTQEEIVNSVEHANERAERLMSLAAARIRLLEERRQTLITAAVTGQFDVTTARTVA